MDKRFLIWISLVLACAAATGCQDRRDPVKPTVGAAGPPVAPAGR